MPSSGSKRAIICTEPGPTRTARGNPRITVVVHFENAHRCGSHVVGCTTAYHEPGEGCDPHVHRGADELFIVRGGRGTIRVGQEDYRVEPGDSVLVLAGTMHSLRAADASDFDNPYHPGCFVVDCILVRAPGHERDDTPWAPTA
jgi:mannose-6-phosphate isomerase-like protein (cupin superfamily)